MNVVVCNGSYKFDYRREFYRAVVVDEDNNIYLSDYCGFIMFPGYVVDNDKRKNIKKYVDELFHLDCNPEYYGSFKYYYLNRYKNIVGKRLFTNSLDITNLYIVRINSKDIHSLDETIVKAKYSELFDRVTDTKSERYKEEMLLLLKMLPEDIKGKEDFKIRMLKRKGTD